ncbi:MAG: lyase family protein, partial [Bifidobacteriales bacterium]|nr:lyase family protein [Bifidobacteriales bacterium]
MNLSRITPVIPLNPLDGRYRRQTADLVDFLSEPALNRERMRVEVEWMIMLANGYQGNGQHPVLPGVEPLTEAEMAYLRAIPEDFDADGITELAGIEAQTHHDVKAVEYYIDRRLEAAATALGPECQLPGLAPLVHFACTSEDINNLAYARCIRGGVEQVWLPKATRIEDHLATMAEQYRDLPMLALTHGQPAT